MPSYSSRRLVCPCSIEVLTTLQFLLPEEEEAQDPPPTAAAIDAPTAPVLPNLQLLSIYPEGIDDNQEQDPADPDDIDQLPAIPLAQLASILPMLPPTCTIVLRDGRLNLHADFDQHTNLALFEQDEVPADACAALKDLTDWLVAGGKLCMWAPGTSPQPPNRSISTTDPSQLLTNTVSLSSLFHGFICGDMSQPYSDTLLAPTCLFLSKLQGLEVDASLLRTLKGHVDAKHAVGLDVAQSARRALDHAQDVLEGIEVCAASCRPAFVLVLSCIPGAFPGACIPCGWYVQSLVFLMCDWLTRLTAFDYCWVF